MLLITRNVFLSTQIILTHVEPAEYVRPLALQYNANATAQFSQGDWIKSYLPGQVLHRSGQNGLRIFRLASGILYRPEACKNKRSRNKFQSSHKCRAQKELHNYPHRCIISMQKYHKKIEARLQRGSKGTTEL